MSSQNLSDSEEEEPDSGSLVVELDEHPEKREETAIITSLKVSKALIKAKPEAYVPQMVSLGPYHHNSLQEDVMDSYKLNSAKDATKDKPTLFDYFLNHVKEMASDFEEFYKIEIEDPTKFGTTMMMDGFFLYQVLKNGLDDLQGETHHPQEEEEEEEKSRNCTGCERLSTALDNKVAAAFGFIFPHPAKQGCGDFVDRYNAKELVKVGVKFKSLAEVPGKIRFENNSYTLFLPKIVISETYTEVVMRNLLALEFNDSSRPKNVSQYVELMNCLINTPEDVTLLRKRNVIDRQSMMITDEYVVKMWEGLAKTLVFSEFAEEPQDIKAAISETLIKNYYKRKIRNWLDRHLCRPFRC